MPFGLLWCCYTHCGVLKGRFTVGRHQCLSAFCGVVTWRADPETEGARERHQCLSAFCGVVTPSLNRNCRARLPASPMPFGLLWCCYIITQLPSPFDESLVTNAFRPFVVLLRMGNGKCRCHEVRVTNAFRPFVVLLRTGRHWSLSVRDVTNAFRPFVVLLQQQYRQCHRYSFCVTNAFRPFVVLLRHGRHLPPVRSGRVTNAFRPFVVLLQIP